MVVIAGEFSSKARVPIPDIVKDTLRNIGYNDGSLGFDCNNCRILTSTSCQSVNIAAGVDCPDGQIGAEKPRLEGRHTGVAGDEFERPQGGRRPADAPLSASER